VRQVDIEPDGVAAGIARATVGRFHDSAAAAGTDHVAMHLRAQRRRPNRDQTRQFAGFRIEAAQRTIFRQPRGAEETIVS